MNDPRSEWYADWFNAEYLKVYSHRDSVLAAREVDYLIEALELCPRRRVLDLCCGAGRHLAQFAARGFERVVGMDLSADLLQAARESGDSPPILVRGDMRALPFGPSFDSVVSLFTSFGYFLEEGENRRVLEEIRRILRPRGKFLLDLVPAQIVDSLVPSSERKVDGLVVRERRWYVETTKRIEKEIRIEGPDGVREFVESVRVYSFSEISRMLAQAGLSITDVRGDFQGGGFVPESERMILLGTTDLVGR